MPTLDPCPRCGRAKTGAAWGRVICLHCHGAGFRRGHGQEAGRTKHRATLARIAATPGEGEYRPFPPPRVVVLRRTDPHPALDDPPPPPPPPVGWPAGVLTLRQRLARRRAAEATRERHP